MPSFLKGKINLNPRAFFHQILVLFQLSVCFDKFFEVQYMSVGQKSAMLKICNHFRHIFEFCSASYTDRNFVDKCSQQVMHFDHEATY
jgi:hypothetical protein